MWENYRTYFQCTGKSVLMCQHQVNSTRLLFIKLPVPLHLCQFSYVPPGCATERKKKQVFSQKEVFLAPEINLHLLTKEKQTCFPKKQITRPIFLKPAVRRYNIYIVLY